MYKTTALHNEGVGGMEGVRTMMADWLATSIAVIRAVTAAIATAAAVGNDDIADMGATDIVIGGVIACVCVCVCVCVCL